MGGGLLDCHSQLVKHHDSRDGGCVWHQTSCKLSFFFGGGGALYVLIMLRQVIRYYIFLFYAGWSDLQIQQKWHPLMAVGVGIRLPSVFTYTGYIRGGTRASGLNVINLSFIVVFASANYIVSLNTDIRKRVLGQWPHLYGLRTINNNAI